MPASTRAARTATPFRAVHIHSSQCPRAIDSIRDSLLTGVPGKGTKRSVYLLDGGSVPEVTYAIDASAMPVTPHPCLSRRKRVSEEFGRGPPTDHPGCSGHTGKVYRRE